MARQSVLHVEAMAVNSIDLEDIEELREKLELALNRPKQVYECGIDLLGDALKADALLGDLYQQTKAVFNCMKVVDFHGPHEDRANCYSSNIVKIRLHAYQVYTNREELVSLQQAVVRHMPHVDFDGQWSQLEFDDDIKEEMVQLITNLLRFRKSSSGNLSPLVLLYGAPGTGKTTLCRSLAQKTSIRLVGSYPVTKLVEIKTATILSKFFSESAKKVDDMFTAIEKMCKDEPDQFLCVLIDEVESIANCRESSMHGEAQDSLRATNALLTGLDRVKHFHNLIILCTSNILGSLDTAFLDRCSVKRNVGFPSSSVQYEMLRSNIQTMIDDGIIAAANNELPSYRDAELELTFDETLPGSRLLQIVKHIDTSGTNTSGRYLSQLPLYSVITYLGDEEDCTLSMALGFVQKRVDADILSPHGQKRKREEEVHKAE